MQESGAEDGICSDHTKRIIVRTHELLREWITPRSQSDVLTILSPPPLATWLPRQSVGLQSGSYLAVLAFTTSTSLSVGFASRMLQERISCLVLTTMIYRCSMKP
jgi:hypothetical protein